MRLLYHRGRTGLCAVLRALGLGPDDEVVVPAFTCVAVPEGVLAAGGRPVYVDVAAEGFVADPDQLAGCFTQRTRAVVAQHTFGLPAPRDRIEALACEHGVPVIEDCCHLRRDQWREAPAGQSTVAALFSYEWGKPLVAGLGGEVVCLDADLEAKLRVSHGKYREPGRLSSWRLALQYQSFARLYHPRRYWGVRDWFRRLSRLKVAEGNYDAANGPALAARELAMDRGARRRLNRAEAAAPGTDWAEAYREAIDSPAFTHPPSDGTFRLARYPLRVERKEAFLKLARARKMEVADWYTSPVHPLEGKGLEAVGYQPGICPHAEARCAEVVSLPMNEKVDALFVRDIAAVCYEHGR